MATTSGPVSYERTGRGSPVVMVHGLGSRWQCFAPIIDRVATQHEVFAVDLPGFGASAADPALAPGPRGYAAWLTGWLHEMGVERPHVVGSSMGGAIALELGRSGIASRVSAFAPAGFYERAGVTWAQGLLTTLRAVGKASPVVDALSRSTPGRAAVLGAVVAHPARVPAETVRDDVRALVGASAFAAARRDLGGYHLRAGDDLGALPDIPVTVAWGPRDLVLLPRQQSRRAREALPSAQHITLDGCGHLPFSDDPERCARIVLG